MDLVRRHVILHGVYRTTEASSFPEVYLTCPLALVGRQDQTLSKVDTLSEWDGRDEGKMRL
jgi:hypothetical protein